MEERLTWPCLRKLRKVLRLPEMKLLKFKLRWRESINQRSLTIEVSLASSPSMKRMFMRMVTQLFGVPTIINILDGGTDVAMVSTKIYHVEEKKVKLRASRKNMSGN